jgi:hypothetical protein
MYDAHVDSAASSTVETISSAPIEIEHTRLAGRFPLRYSANSFPPTFRPGDLFAYGRTITGTGM